MHWKGMKEGRKNVDIHVGSLLLYSIRVSL